MVQASVSRRKSEGFVAVVLALLAIFPPLSTDMYLSAFNDIQAAFNVPDGSLEISLSVFFLGLGIGQLMVGPLIDRMGRRGPLLFGIAVFCIATVLLLCVDSVGPFIALRLVHAVWACGGMVVGRAVISDMYTGRRAIQMLTLLVTLMSLSSITAPFLGSLLVTFVGWQSVFVMMLVVDLAAFGLSWWIIPETLPVSRRTRTPITAAFRDYAGLFVGAENLSSAEPGGAAFVQAAVFSYIISSSSIFIGHYGLTNIQYGLCFGLVAVVSSSRRASTGSFSKRSAS
ncbi:MFS transporter [Breoghania sp.]|uniref:MFS transporter n=1 Tax=Breoghania sp. TaxID=2065378 RepID=UPI0026033B03|nr:MFS transporter [Breoghania sp.]MDJ0931058.1 MFS transporter [Breoghania sp.]